MRRNRTDGSVSRRAISILSTAVLVKAPRRTRPGTRRTISGITLVLPVPGGPQMRWNDLQVTERSIARSWLRLNERANESGGCAGRGGSLREPLITGLWGDIR